MQEHILKQEETYGAPLEKVWNAITDKDRMRQWYFDIPDFKGEG